MTDFDRPRVEKFIQEVNMKQPKIINNGPDGLQIEWDGVLITIGPNAHHGIKGSIAINDSEEGVHVVDFHGGHARGGPFPMVVHEMRRLEEDDPT